MTSILRGNYAQCIAWWIRRNPTYLVSAACLALGARLYLLEPRTRAGDIDVILMTFGVLQAYELAVAAVLLMLHRQRRSPEDEPSLLLVATLFWTGPLAATREMAVHRPHLGLILSLGVCIIALTEMQIIRRLMRLRLGSASQLFGCACVTLLAASPPFLIVPKQADGTNEICLYFVWWVLALVALAGLAVIRSCPCSSAGETSLPAKREDFHIELAFFAITLAATVAHLAAMNYAFFCHARWFYASPLIIVVAVLVVKYVAGRPALRWPLAAVLILPGMAIALAHARFDEHVPVRALPAFLRDPLLTTLILAGIAWWFAYRRLRCGVFLHAGSLAIAWAAYRAVMLFRPDVTPLAELPRDLITAALYAAVAYLLLLAWWRRSRIDLVVALVCHLAAFSSLVRGQTQVDSMLTLLLAGWTWLAGLHLGSRRPSLSLALWPVCLLIVVTWAYDFREATQWIARANAGAMIVVLAAVGLVWPMTRYRLIAAATAAANVGFHCMKWIMTGKNPVASFVVLAGFILLIAGAFIGWHKARLLTMCNRPESADPGTNEGGPLAIAESD